VNFGVGGTAAFNTDFNQTGATSFNTTVGSVTIPAGSTTATVTLDPIADSAVEGDEAVTLTIASGSGYSIGTANGVTGTILDVAPRVSLSLDPQSVSEDGSDNLVYTFTRTGSLAEALTVNIGIGGTAIVDVDYTQSGATSFSGTGTVTFAPGAATATVTIDPKADSTPESDETVFLQVQAGAGYLPGTIPPVGGKILNDDAQVSVTLSSASQVMEDGPQNFVYTIGRSGLLSVPLTVTFNIGGTATLDNDYTLTGATMVSATQASVTFPAGVFSVQVTVDPTADTLPELDETVVLIINPGPGYQPLSATAIGTILGEETAVHVVSTSSSIGESVVNVNSDFSFTVERVGPTSTPLTIDFTLSGTATQGIDYYFYNGVSALVIPAGASQGYVSFKVRPDVLIEDNETVIFSLSPTAPYEVNGPTTATLIIIDDDTVLNLASSTQSVPESSTTGLVYTVTRGPGDISRPITAGFNLTGSAGILTDFYVVGATTLTPTSGTVVIPADSQSATFSLIPIDDTLVELDETVTVTLLGGLEES
jgi:hypothetical protein